MKILFLLHDFLPEHVGGTEVHTAELALELARRGHEPVILCTERDLARADGDLRERRHAGLRVLEVAHRREYACAEETWEEPRQQAVFERILRGERPAVLHAQHFAQWGTGVLRAARAAGVPAVVTLHDYHLLCASSTLQAGDGSLCEGDCAKCFAGLPPSRAGGDARARESAAEARREQHRRDLALAHTVIAPSQFLAELFLAGRMVRAQQLARVDSGVAGPWREPRASDPATPLRLGYVGGLYPSKGVHVLIDAFARLEPGLATLDVHGVLEWFPSYVAHLHALAGPRTDVRWHGRFAPEAVDGILDSLDVLVAPSLWYENRPLTIQAAFRRGLAVVASDLGGLAELLDHGRRGALVPHGDARLLGDCLRELARDRDRVLALARARPPMASMEDVALRHLALYASAAGGALSSGNP